MSEISLGRVMPVYLGEWDSSVVYQKLDQVSYQGSGWICIDRNINVTPTTSGGYWQLVAAKGDKGDKGNTGDFSDAIASASALLPDEAPTASIVISGPPDAKVLNLELGIPAGPYGFDINDVRASASSEYGDATASASIINNKLTFAFNIPPADGTGVSSVDGIGPTGTGSNRNVVLTAVRYGENQGLSAQQQSLARNNINAQVAGDYLQSVTDTMNGTLSIKSDNIIDGNIPSTIQEGEALNFADSSDNVISYIQPIFQTNGTQTLELATTRNINDTNYSNGITLAIDSAGNNLVSLSDPEVWRNALGVVSGDVTPAKDSGVGSAGSSGAYARADHYHPVNVSSNAPPPDAVVAAAGSAETYARSDHAHQINISTTVSDVKSDAATASLGSSAKYARVDHAHPLNVSTAVADIKPDASTASLGSSAKYARADHAHPLNVATSGTPAALGVASLGTANTYARTDHVHTLPNVSSLNGTLTIGHGGTGATTSALARAALGAAAVPSYISISLPSGNWGNEASANSVYYWSQSGFTVEGGTANSIIDLMPDATTLCAMVQSGTAAIYVANDNGTFYAYAIDAKPTTDLNNIPAIRWEQA